MVASADGAAAVAGLVGAGTIRAEGYGPDLVTPDEKRRRAAAGDPPVPRLAIVTRSLDLDLAAPLFTAAVVRPVIVPTASAPADRHAAAAEVADIITVGDE